MLVNLSHTTVYRYSGSVTLEPHVIRLRPRDDAAQRLLQHQLLIFPTPRGQSTFLDAEGNVAVQAWFEGPTRELSVSSMFQVETLRSNPFDFLLPCPRSLALPLVYDDPLPLAPYLSTTDGLGQFSGEMAQEAGGQLMPFLERLALHLFSTSSHIYRPEGAPNAPVDTLRCREGSCRDLAVLFCAVCRAQGIAARFVSGYEREAAFQEESFMHAWAEVYIPGGGWRGYDPARGFAVGTSHVAVAAAAAPADAAPVTGTFRGSATAAMTFTISMQAGERA